jgi:hypothetical protein
VPHIWTVKDSTGHLVPNFTGTSRLDVERRLVPTYYDAFRLHVSPSYREIFDRELAKVLSDKHWRIIRIRTSVRRTKASRLGAQDNGLASGCPL